MSSLRAVLRSLVFAIALLSMSACTHGINAGEKGGQAFIAFAGMLIVTIGVLWFVLGREK